MISHPRPDMCFPDAFRVFVPVGRHGLSRVYSFALLHFMALFSEESFPKTAFSRWNHWDSQLFSNARGCRDVRAAVPVGALATVKAVTL